MLNLGSFRTAFTLSTIELSLSLNLAIYKARPVCME